MSPLARLAILTLVVEISACKARHHRTSEVTAVVNDQQFERAKTIATKLSYVPFEHSREGCFARALYFGMELAAAEIPSSSTFAVAADGETFGPDDTYSWHYHVATMLKIGASGIHQIFDPAFSSFPLSVSAWLKKFKADKAKVVSVPASTYGYRQLGEEKIIETFEELPPFRLVDISRACGFLFAQIKEEQSEKSEGREKLLKSRTDELIKLLREKKKIAEDPEDEMTCELVFEKIPFPNRGGDAL